METTPTHLVVITVFPGIDAVDVAGPAEVFAMANIALPDSAARYEVRVVAAHSDVVPTSSGLRIGVDQHFAELQERPDTILVTGRVDVGDDDIPTAVVDDEVCDWLCEHGPQAGRVATVCAGAHIAAAAGLLDGAPRNDPLGNCATTSGRPPSGRGRPRPHLRTLRPDLDQRRDHVGYRSGAAYD